MKYVAPTIELIALSTDGDIMTLSTNEMAAYGSSMSFWDAEEM